MNILQSNRAKTSFMIVVAACLSVSFSAILPNEMPQRPLTSKQPIAQSPDTTQWLEVVLLDSTILLDLRYATTNNFVGQQMYDCPRCFLRPAVAKALIEVHRELRKKGFGLKLYDCYRPQSVQWALWKKVPDPRYVADPRKGSMHNRGSAIDLTIVDQTGKELDMGTPYDYFGVEAYIDYTKHPKEVLANRKMLQELMIAKGFRTTRTEWWHFSYTKAFYALSDMRWSCP